MNELNFSDDALGRLRAAKAVMLDREDIRKIQESKDQVLARYNPAFQTGAIDTLSEDVLRSFLYFENNHHWSGLNRQVNRICADMEATRQALAELVDETLPIEGRMHAATGIKGMGKGIITAILHVAYPYKYGVWNNTSNDGLLDLGLLPAFPRGASFGERYEAVNRVLTHLAQELDVDLWTLDTMWWFLHVEEDLDEEETNLPEEPADPLAKGQNTRKARFALERHLHDYMFDNWDMLDLAKEWNIFSRDGEPEAGYEFRTPIGRIDLLARHKTDPRWLVIELKREKSSDAVVGQVLRYMGWVQKHLVEDGEEVEGLVVATEGDPQLHYALEVVPSVSFKSYEVEFRLKAGPSFEEFAKP
ncbi:endonuclease NucS domain-containing protein [uncultured Roseibium sp.]|uniref:endonuclease NucS domain-containing protein n=1 Tax=uncultured Roseibium sp. TaxID=1936171 RepID=UPI00262EF941|nr:endonuclease NucS domain-containing protein [uncultured Roseibium sp.]